MPYYKRKALGRKLNRKPRRYIRRKPLSGITRAVRQSHRVKYFTDTCDLGSMLVPIGAGTGYTFDAYLNMLPADSLTAYQNMFDQYCIIKYQYHFIPSQGQYNYGGSPAPDMVHYAVNRDGAAGAVSSPISVLSDDYSKSRVADGRSKIIITVNNPKPYLRQSSGDTGGLIAVNQKYKTWQWIDLNDDDSPNIKHYGIRMWVDNSSGVAHTPYRVLCKMTIAFKEQQ